MEHNIDPDPTSMGPFADDPRFSGAFKPPRHKVRFHTTEKKTVKITTWHGTTIAAGHSLIQKVNRIADAQERDELTSVSVRGREGTGKTTVARVMAHYLHTELNKRAASTAEPESEWAAKSKQAIQRGYIVRVLSADDLTHFKNTLDSLPDANRILIFDDTSFMGASASKSVQKIKREVTTVRHGSGADYRTVLFFNFHYSKGLDPYLRDTNFLVQTGTTSGEMHALHELYGTNPTNTAVLDRYRGLEMRLKKSGSVRVSLSNDRRFARRPKLPAGQGVTYKYSNPFRLALFFDQETLSIMVYPSTARAGADKCEICRPAAAAAATGIDPEAVIQFVTRQTSEAAVGAAMKDMFVRKFGRDPYDRKANQARVILERLEANGAVTYEGLFGAYQQGKMSKNQPLDALVSKVRRPIRLKAGARERFAAMFGADCLRAPNDKPLEAIDKTEQLADMI